MRISLQPTPRTWILVVFAAIVAGALTWLEASGRPAPEPPSDAQPEIRVGRDVDIELVTGEGT